MSALEDDPGEFRVVKVIDGVEVRLTLEELIEYNQQQASA